MDRELDIEIAQRIFGWEWGDNPDGVRFFRHPSNFHYGAIEAGGERFIYDVLPHYSTDHTAVRLVEDEIERRGLVGPYVKALYAIVGKQGSWSLIRATPEQRCVAALRAVGGREGECKP